MIIQYFAGPCGDSKIFVPEKNVWERVWGQKEYRRYWSWKWLALTPKIADGKKEAVSNVSVVVILLL